MAIKNMVQFLNQVKFELSKVEWPSFSVFIGSTIVVLMLVLFFSLYLGVIDFGFAKLARYVFGIYGGN